MCILWVFQSGKCFWDSFMWLNISKICSFLLLNIISLYGYTLRSMHSLLVNILVDEHFSCIQLKAIMNVMNIHMRASFCMTCSSSGFCLVFPHDKIPIFSLHRVSHLIHLSYISNVNFNHFIRCFPLSLMYTYYFFLPLKLISNLWGNTSRPWLPFLIKTSR